MHRLCETFLDCYKILSIKIRLLMRMMSRGYSVRIRYRCAACIRLKIKKSVVTIYAY